jgi:hypothetical protein
MGTRDKTWPLAISGHPSSSAYPRKINSYALEKKTKGSSALTPTLGVLSMLLNNVTAICHEQLYNCLLLNFYNNVSARRR